MKLQKEAIKKLFEELTDQGEILGELYRMVFPDWSSIESIEGGWPKVHPETALELSRMFIQFDRKHHPDVMAGGLWLNSGFSSGPETLPLWAVSVDHLKIIYKSEAGA